MDGSSSNELDIDSKRYILSKEEISRNRLNLFRQTFKRVSGEYPEVVGATVFGSMVKGNANPESDIDAFVFVDLDQAKSEYAEDEYDRARKKLKNEPNRNSYPLLSEDLLVMKKFKPLFETPLRESGLTAEDLRDLRIMAISQQYIKDEIAKAIKNAQELEAYKAESEKIGSGWFAWSIDHPRPEIHMIDWRLPALFHLALGKNLQKYRQLVIDGLFPYGQIGDDLWKRYIIGRTADLERNLKGESYSNLYPQTIEAATNYYHLKNPSHSEPKES